jgi:excisionase family DNA binding protein
MDDSETRRMLSLVEMAAYLGIHPESLRRAYRAGRVRAYKIGRTLRFDPLEVRADLRASIRRPMI